MSRPFASARSRRLVALTMAVALLFAGIAEAAHFHKADPVRHGDTHLQCLLCLHSTGTAGPPTVPQLVAASRAPLAYVLPEPTRRPQSALATSYFARGPPLI